MKPSELAKTIAMFQSKQIGRCLHVESSPGTGKTQIVAQVADALKVGFKKILVPLLQPEDYGFPVISSARDAVDFVVSHNYFPIVGSDCPENGILLFDEIAGGDNSAQKICAHVLQEKEIHGKRLKPGWTIVTTGNRTVDRAGSNRLLSHLKNRLTVVELEPNLDDWCNWALENGVNPEVIGFIRFRPALLNAFDPQNEVNATPRSWVEGVSDALGSIDPVLEFELFKGAVGEGAASEFIAFLKIYRKLPNPDAILMAPKTAEVPKDPATLFAVCGAMAHRSSEDNFDRVMTYMQRLPSEFSMLFVRDAMKLKPEVQHTPAFIQWMAKHGSKLLS